MEINNQIDYSKKILFFLDTICTNSTISKSDLISIAKNKDTILEAISSIFSYVDFVKNGAKSMVLAVKGGKVLEIYLNPSETHVSQAKEYIKTNELNEDFLVKDLFLETKEDSKLERLEYILGEKPKNRCKNGKQKFIF